MIEEDLYKLKNDVEELQKMVKILVKIQQKEELNQDEHNELKWFLEE